MIGWPAGTRIWIVAGVTDLRRGFVGLPGLVQIALAEDPFSGQVFVFRGRRGDLIKVQDVLGGHLQQTPPMPPQRTHRADVAGRAKAGLQQAH